MGPSPTPAGAAPDPAATFRAWAQSASKKANLVICRWGLARYDRDQEEARFAIFRDDKQGPPSWAIAVAWGKHRRLFRSAQDPARLTGCPGENTPAVWELVRAITFPTFGGEHKETSTVALVDGRLVQLAEQAEGERFASKVDWDALEETVRTLKPKAERAAAILPIVDVGSSWRPKLPRPRTWTTFSRRAPSGPDDVALDVRLSIKGDALQIEMTAADDAALPVPVGTSSDAAWLKRDHFQLWFCAADGPPSCDKKTARQLAVVTTADGQGHARWLHPKGHSEALPEVRPGPAPVIQPPAKLRLAATVILPLKMIRHDGDAPSALQGQLTVAYSDADTATGGQETVVATSKLKGPDGRTFGRFVRQADGGRFPVWLGSTAFTPDDEFLATLPPLPE
ncbi:MAG TPA: hypothetical protein VGG33_19470 [Polyangia bacterium]